MPVPPYTHFIEPILRYLAKYPDGVRASNVHDAAADLLGVSPNDKLEVLPSGNQAVYKNRSGWAHDRLKRAGLSSSPRRGFWKLTPRGITFVKDHPIPLMPEQVAELADSGPDIRLRDHAESTSFSANVINSEIGTASASPDDRLNEAWRELRAATARDLLEAIAQNSPGFFEKLVLDLLHKMGYGTGRQDLQHVGGSGDGGIDGIISLDRLGLEKVCIQAKRWQTTATVGPDAVQAFSGALVGRRVTKGVFITTSSYSRSATEFARSTGQIVLIDGAKLAELLMDFGVGVSHREIRIPRIDRDYFEEGE